MQSDDAHAKETNLVVATHAALLIDVEAEGVVQVGDSPDTDAIA
jgi:hypothetical protein